ncbi:MAG: SusC/RagA family TonB-linked outer membrane protein [Sphingobacteriia bacterium]|nr:SusC/RagA family TonB-linked outer membrane protein [Sphingobacteriia bacterium]
MLLCFFIALTHVIAQTRTITGKVIDEKGNPIADASILVKGTTVGTFTSKEGTFSLKVSTTAKTLIVVATNFTTKEIAIDQKNDISVSLKSSSNNLDEVVVTALGISKDRKTLGYSPQTIKAEALENKGDNSLLNLLQGKVAGADITGASGSAGASTNIVLRGMSSINGSNQPLFVVDGIPISNDLDQTAGTLYGNQPANRAMDLNPSTIESINVLTGPAAAVLYGSRASNGAIVITTKKGSGQKGRVDISFSSSYSQQKVYGFPKLQNSYGQGSGGVFSSTSTSSWGPAFGATPTLTNGLITSAATNVNGINYAAGSTIDYKPYSTNLIDFFNVGNNFDNTLLINGGDTKNYFSANLGSSVTNGIMPNTNFKKNSVGFSAGSQLTNKLNISGGVNFYNTLQLGTTQGNGGNSAMFALWGVTRSTNLAYYKDNYKNLDGSNNWWVSGRDNPYFASYENPITSNLIRFIGNLKISYDVTNWLNISYRLGADAYNDRRKRIVAIGSTQASGTGRVTEDIFFRSEFNGDLLINMKKSNLFKGLNANLLLGQNINQRTYQNATVTALSLTIPNFYNVSNGTNFSSSGEYSSKRRLVGYFGQLSLGYKNYLNGELTLRVDQSSTLPKKNNSYLYYSYGGSFIFTEALKLNSKILNFGKIRASYAKVGNDAAPYKLENSFSKWSYGNNVASFSFPYGTVTGFGASSTLPNPDLTPEFSTSIEFGGNLGFLKDRLTLDVTFYKTLSTNQIIDVAIPTSTGYDSRTINVGKISNKGIELTIGGTPIKSKNFQWTISANFAKNRNVVEELYPGVTQMNLPGSYFGGVAPSVVVGQPYGVIVGSTIPRSPDGQYLIDSTTGSFATSITNQVVANPNRDWSAGLGNTFRYKNLTLSFLVDYKQGGQMLSWTIATLRSNGSLDETGVDRDKAHILPGVVSVGGGKYVSNYIQIPAQTYWSNLGGIGGGEMAVFDATTFRLRELSLTYDLPLKNTNIIKGLKLTVFGRNLFYYSPNCLIDPEVNTQGAGNIRGLELQSAPNTRNMGCSIKISL